MTRFNFIKKHGLEGAKLGIISIEWLVKYDAYLVYRETLEMLEGQKFTEPRTPKSEAIWIASQRCRCDRSCMAKYIYAFEKDPELKGPLIINRSGHRWISNFSRTVRIAEKE